MAITIDDFSKIWASTSPLTPYEFSENNYKEGWNFVGATPPSRQMWDFLQKNNDEKMQYLADNYLPLSGGTMTGDLVLNSAIIKNSVDTTTTTICGGDSSSNGSYLRLYGKNSSYPGLWGLRADDGANISTLLGHPDGTLTWGGNDVITSALLPGVAFSLSDSNVPTIPNGSDLNDYLTAGTYRTAGSSATASLSNCPASGSAIKLLVVSLGYGTSSYAMQIVFAALRGIYIRSRTNNTTPATWSSWGKLNFTDV